MMRTPLPCGPALSAGAIGISLIAAELLLALFGFDTSPRGEISYPPHLDTTAYLYGRPYRLRTNAEGFRYSRLEDRPQGGPSRVLVLGDSFVDGVGVPEGFTLPRFLENRARLSGGRTRFMNFAVAGAGPAQYEKILERYAESTRADAVLLCVYANDLSDAGSAEPPRRASWAERALPRLCALIRQARIGGQWSRWHRRSARLDQAPAPAMAQPDDWLGTIDIRSAEDERLWRRFAESWQRLRQSCRGRDLPLAVVYIPHAQQYDPNYRTEAPAGTESPPETVSEFQRRLDKLCATGGVPFLDLTPLLAGSSKALHFGFDPHWNARGHRAAATAVYDWLARLNVFKIDRLPGPPKTRAGPSGA